MQYMSFTCRHFCLQANVLAGDIREGIDEALYERPWGVFDQ